ncbi:probable RNA-directed DNA polymerase from transposon X-element [Trichonephila clavipes]|nr:probable RNA-directed DNA polymerase from transposon X-element [Trichonephila clavipes]
MFGTRVAFEPYDGFRNRRPNQWWRCQGFFHSSEICHLPMKCLKCAGAHQAKDCTLHFEDPLKCANCGGEHAANWRQCPRFPKSKKGSKPSKQSILRQPQSKLNLIIPPIRIVSAYARNTPENNRKFPDKDFLKILNSGQNIIIAGDLNAARCTWSNARSNAFGYALRKIVNKSDVRIVAPRTPTHINASSRTGARDSITDLAVPKNIPFNHDIRLIDDLESDHLPVILTLYTGSALIKIPDQLSTNWENFKFLLSNKPLPIPPSSCNDDLEIAIRLGENISEALIEASKPKQPSLKLPSEIKAKIRHRNRIRKFWQHTRDPAVNSEFRTLSREGALGSIANHPLEKMEVIADSLQKQFEPNTEAEYDRFTARTQRKIKRFLDTPTCLDLKKTTPGEVHEYIKKLKINKSPGLDLITNRILKNLPLQLVLFIVMLFNLLMENCHFPKNWKTAVVVPILKPNSDDTQPQNYRPISLLSSLSKKRTNLFF